MDVLGQAIWDFFQGQNGSYKLWVEDTIGPKVEMPVATYFRHINSMPEIEKLALQNCTGHVLDIGAGAGSHALQLQAMGLTVTALDISPLNAEVMRERGVQKVIASDIYQYRTETFDTLLLLMNGIGLCGSLSGFRKLLKHAEKLLLPGGKLLFDSSDIAYLYEESGVPSHQYYGEFRCRYKYKKMQTEWFSWLYIDFRTMSDIASSLGWQASLIYEDEHNQYLAELFQK